MPSMLQINSRQEIVVNKQNLTYDLLKPQDSITTNGIIDVFVHDENFNAVSGMVTEEIMQRDQEDADKLVKGINLSIEQGVLEALAQPPVYTKIAVEGKSADEVADELLGEIPEEKINSGCIIVLCGLSGTGKGTTVSKIKERVEKCHSWSNGNIFRSLTKLSLLHCNKHGVNVEDVVKDSALLQTFMDCLSFVDRDGNQNYDTHIKSEELDIDVWVNDVKNTILKAADVAKSIPTVAEQSQAHVVKFVDTAVQILQNIGYTVLVEGRQQTVDYVNSPYRFELTLSNPNIIGMRRTAQRMASVAFESVKDHTEISYDEVFICLNECLMQILEHANAEN